MSDEGPELADGSLGLLKIMMLTGAAVGMFSVFQLWFSYDMGFHQFDYTGFDFFLKSRHFPDNYPGIGYYAYMPLIVFAASAVSVITSVLTFTKHERRGAIAGTVIGMVILAAVILYIFYPASSIAISTPGADLVAYLKLRNHLDSGVYSAIAAGIFVVIGGVVILLNRKNDPRA